MFFFRKQAGNYGITPQSGRERRSEPHVGKRSTAPFSRTRQADVQVRINVMPCVDFRLTSESGAPLRFRGHGKPTCRFRFTSCRASISASRRKTEHRSVFADTVSKHTRSGECYAVSCFGEIRTQSPGITQKRAVCTPFSRKTKMFTQKTKDFDIFSSILLFTLQKKESIIISECRRSAPHRKQVQFNHLYMEETQWQEKRFPWTEIPPPRM